MLDRTISVYNIGVGGFGIGYLNRVLSQAAQKAGYDVRGSDTHGLAQRGGVVTSTLKIGPKIEGSPLIVKGTADVVLALEPLEALRAMPFLKKGGTIIYNTAKIQPLGVRLKTDEYPELSFIEAELRQVTENVIPLDAAGMAKELGLSQTVNVILLGVLVRRGVLPFDLELIKEVVAETTPPRFKEVNLKALEIG